MRGMPILMLTAALVGWAGSPAAAQIPPGWRWIPDRPDTASPMVQMPPGWHITTGPGALLYDPAMRASDRYALESEVFLFPRGSNQGYGVFLGGRNLGEATAAYLAVLLRRDGQFAIEGRQHGVASTQVPWTPAAAIRRVTGDSTARNVIRISVERDSLFVEVNATRVAGLARGELPVEGQFGFRAGEDLSIHVSRLDFTRRLAPAPRR